MKLLLIESDNARANLIQQGLEEARLLVDYCACRDRGLHQAQTSVYDATVLGNEVDGVKTHPIIRAMRQEGDNTPLIITATTSLLLAV